MGDAVEQPKARMTVDEFLAWAEDRPGRHELVNGQPHAMAPERVGHARAKIRAHRTLEGAVARAGLPCEALPDGLTIRIDARTAYEPDASVYCGPRLPENDVIVPAPVIVVEVLSPSTGFFDRHGKLAGYFSVPGIAHYLIVDIDRRMVIHHARDGDEIRTRLVPSGPLRLDPPGLELEVGDLFGPADDPAP